MSKVVWIRGLLAELDCLQASPTKIYCDNQATIQIAGNYMYHERTKHIEVDYRFIRDKILDKVIQTQHVSSIGQLANVLT